MRTETTDPITGNTIDNPEGHPFIVEGTGDNALKIFSSRRIASGRISTSKWSIPARISPPTWTIRPPWEGSGKSDFPGRRKVQRSVPRIKAFF